MVHRVQGSKRRWLAQSFRQQGQALLEAALVMPMLLVLVFGVVLVGRVTYAKVAVQAAVREAGRTLASAPSEVEGLASAEERGLAVAANYGLAQDRFFLTLSGDGFQRGGIATARASYQVQLADLPLLDRAEFTVRSEHRERIDRYRSRGSPEP